MPQTTKKYDDLQAEAMDYYDKKLSFTDEEVHHFSQSYIEKYRKLEKEFCQKTKLTSFDISIMLVAAALQTLRWYFMDNKSLRFNSDNDADKAVEGILGKAGEYLPADVASLLTDHSVPYDTVRRSAMFMAIYPGESVGLSGTNHRYMTLGHDPVAGWIVGTANIATNTLAVNDWRRVFPSYHVRDNCIDGKTSLCKIMKWSWEILCDKPEVIGLSFLKQSLHYSTDVFTKQGLPIPVINSVSPEASKFLIGNGIDVYSVARGMAMAALVNKLVEMFHKLFYDEYTDGDSKLYEVRSRKIVVYSNTLSSVLNVGYVACTDDFTKLDVGGIIVTMWRKLNDSRTVLEIKKEFIE